MYNSNIVCRYTGQSVWYVDGSTGNKSIDIDQPGLQIWQISTSSHFQRSFSSSNHGHIIVTLEQQGVSNGRIDPQRISAPPLSPLFPLPFSIPFSTSSSTPRFLLSYHLFFDFFFFPSYLSSIVFSFFFLFFFFLSWRKLGRRRWSSPLFQRMKRGREREKRKKKRIESKRWWAFERTRRFKREKHEIYIRLILFAFPPAFGPLQ